MVILLLMLQSWLCLNVLQFGPIQTSPHVLLWLRSLGRLLSCLWLFWLSLLLLLPSLSRRFTRGAFSSPSMPPLRRIWCFSQFAILVVNSIHEKSLLILGLMTTVSSSLFGNENENANYFHLRGRWFDYTTNIAKPNMTFTLPHSSPHVLDAFTSFMCVTSIKECLYDTSMHSTHLFCWYFRLRLLLHTDGASSSLPILALHVLWSIALYLFQEPSWTTHAFVELPRPMTMSHQMSAYTFIVLLLQKK